VGFPPKRDILMEIYLSNLMFIENQNDPYGPYEPLLWDISQNKYPNIKFPMKTHFFEKWPWPQFRDMLFLVEKIPCEVPPQQNQGFKHTPEYSRPKRDQICYQNCYLYRGIVGSRGFSIKK